MNRFIRAGTRAFKEPGHLAVRGLGYISPTLLLSRLSWLAARQGLKRPFFVLSFDCDTVEDIEIVESVHARLLEIGIMAVYAVPGRMLERGEEVYRRIAATGAEFINHGYEEHCRLDPETRTYISDVFYDQMAPQDVASDIRRGHETHVQMFGRPARGFRTPHFGSYQRRDHLAFLHKTLGSLGYLYSSSTTPIYGFVNGPLSRAANGVYEIPVSGCHDEPLQILDSWGFRFDPNRTVDEHDYVREFNRMAAQVMDRNRPGLLNYYADPSQVYDWPEFFDCMKAVSSIAARSYEDLLVAAAGPHATQASSI